MNLKVNQAPIEEFRKSLNDSYLWICIEMILSFILLILCYTWSMVFLPLLIIFCMLTILECSEYRYRCTIVRIHDMNESLYKRLKK